MSFDEPQSRNEALLQDLLGASNEFGEPQSRNEAILQNMLGANNVLVKPQSRIETLLQDILEQGIGGNTVQTVTGTVGDPFGDIDYTTLRDALKNDEATAKISFTYLTYNVSFFLRADNEIYGNTAFIDARNDVYLAAFATWHEFDYLEAYMVGTQTQNTIVDATATVGSLTSTLDVIWHPLPSGGGNSD